jgi:hypothetical protein
LTFSDVPYHQEVLSAHQSHLCQRASAEGRGFQIDKHETERGTLQICQAAPRGWDNGICAQLASVSIPDFAIIKSIKIPMAGPMLPPTSHQFVHNMTALSYIVNNNDHN